MPVLAVDGRVEVGAAAEEQAVEAVEPAPPVSST